MIRRTIYYHDYSILSTDAHKCDKASGIMNTFYKCEKKTFDDSKKLISELKPLRDDEHISQSDLRIFTSAACL